MGSSSQTAKIWIQHFICNNRTSSQRPNITVQFSYRLGIIWRIINMVCAIDSTSSSKHATWGFGFVGLNRFAVQNIFMGPQILSPREKSSTRTYGVYYIVRKPESSRIILDLVLLRETALLSSNGWPHFPTPRHPYYLPESGNCFLFVPSCIFFFTSSYILNLWFSSGTSCFPFNISVLEDVYLFLSSTDWIS